MTTTDIWAKNELRRRKTRTNVDLDRFTVVGRLIGATAFQLSCTWASFRSADVLMESDGMFYFSCVTKAGEKQLIIAKLNTPC